MIAPLDQLLQNRAHPSYIEAFYVYSDLNEALGDQKIFYRSVMQFCKFDRGIVYPFCQTILKPVDSLRNIFNDRMQRFQSTPDLDWQTAWARMTPDLREHLDQTTLAVRSAINQVPITWEAEFVPDGSPLTAYIKIQQALGTANKRVHLIDPYVHPRLFSLYFNHLDHSVETYLITKSNNIKHVIDQAKLAYVEFDKFRLLKYPNEKSHDRNLRVDDNIFNLGGSVKDLAVKSYYNFTVADSTQTGHDFIDDIIENQCDEVDLINR